MGITSNIYNPSRNRTCVGFEEPSTTMGQGAHAAILPVLVFVPEPEKIYVSERTLLLLIPPISQWIWHIYYLICYSFNMNTYFRKLYIRSASDINVPYFSKIFYLQRTFISFWMKPLRSSPTRCLESQNQWKTHKNETFSNLQIQNIHKQLDMWKSIHLQLTNNLCESSIHFLKFHLCLSFFLVKSLSCVWYILAK